MFTSADNVIKHDLVWLGDVTRDGIETIKWDMPGIKATIDFCLSSLCRIDTRAGYSITELLTARCELEICPLDSREKAHGKLSLSLFLFLSFSIMDQDRMPGQGMLSIVVINLASDVNTSQSRATSATYH